MALPPDYILAADIHNLGNTNTSWLDPNFYAQKIGNTGRFLATSILSGTNSFYNTGVAIGNFFGADVQERQTDAWISQLDSNWGEYYRQNREAADITGFVLGSIVPGFAGIKVFNAGQLALRGAIESGKIGGNLAKATGLLVPNISRYVTLATNEINQSVTTVKLINANTLKALGSGVWQNTLESAAFETVAMATQFRSPVLDQMDMMDVMSNISIGAGLGGVIGGAFDAAKIFGTLKKSKRIEDRLRDPFLIRPSFTKATPASEKIISLAWDSEMSAVPIRLTKADGTVVFNNFSVDKQLFTDKLRKNTNDIRTEINSLSGGDLELGNIISNAITPIKGAADNIPIGFAVQVFENFKGVVGIARYNVETSAEIAARKAVKAGETIDSIAIRFVQTMGENTGKITDLPPTVLSLGDILRGKKAILSRVRDEGFKLGDNWSALKLTGANAHLKAEARHIWAHSVLKEIKEGTAINLYDIPLLERAYLDNQLNITIQIPGPKDTLISYVPRNRTELWGIIKESKVNLANELLLRMSYKGGIPIEEGTVAAAKIANVKLAYLEGTRQSADEFSDLMAYQSTAIEYRKGLEARGLSMSTDEAITDPLFLPKLAKFVYKINDAAISENVADAVVYFKEKQVLYQEQAKNVVAKVLGKFAEMFPDSSDTAILNLSRADSSAGLFSFENSNYGTYGSRMALIGSVTRTAKEEFRKSTTQSLESTLVALGRKPEAAIEFEGINQQITRSGKLWVYDAKAKGMRSLSRKGDSVDDEEFIPIVNSETAKAIELHIANSRTRTIGMQEIRAAQGKTDEKIPDVFRPIRPDLKQYPHFAFIRDPRVTGSGHMSVITAASEKELGQLLDRVPPEFQKVLKSDVDEFKKARGEYEYSRSLHENYLDANLQNKGIFSSFFPKSDPQKIIDDILQQNLRESDMLVTESVRLRYESEFNLLEDLGRQYSKVDVSKFTGRNLEDTVDNPYFNHIKTALDISKINEYPLIYSFNKSLDEAVSKFQGVVTEIWNGVKTSDDLDKINAALDKYGIKPAYYDAALHALANHSAPRGELTKFVRKANSLLSLFTLGLDPLNALNNAIGSNILRMTELRHLTKAISQGNTEVAGELGRIGKIKLPGVDNEILAPTKLVSQAIKNFWEDRPRGEMKLIKMSDAGPIYSTTEKETIGPLLKKYKDMGLIKDRAEQLKILIDDFTLKGTESVAELESRISTGLERARKIADKGEAITGNKLSEEFNRFISANVMDQITEIAIKNGLMDSREAAAYINTFVNRVEGNMIASQRPMIFQGPIGQAIGLFQSYQFNLIQQLLRYVSEGSRKDIATLLGLQSTLYGIQSLPGFQFINTHIVGQLSGNPEHRDAYDAVYGIAGRTAGNFVLYGIPSNILQTNIYSRGDINPRQITILPTSFQEVPLVAGWGKFLDSMLETVSKVSGGGNIWESILQGVEHNGISRPLAGMAQVFQGLPSGIVYSTSNKGSILYSNDLFSIASLSRLAGGRPLDEAIANDALFRVRSYEASRRVDRQKLAEVVKTSLISGNEATQEQLLLFAQRYAETGGKQAGFNRWMMELYKNANVPQSQQLQQSLSNPFAYKMQLLMGGDEE